MFLLFLFMIRLYCAIIVDGSSVVAASFYFLLLVVAVIPLARIELIVL
jgi:hypothetical protein